jgi:protein-S-isoprenylcysteine O-methyltransferase Ste14
MPQGVCNNVFLVGLIAGCVIRAMGTVRANRERRQESAAVIDRRRVRLDWPLLVLAFVGMQVLPLVYVLTPWLEFADYRLPDWVGLAGAVVFSLALWLLWRSHADLGRHWSAKLEIRQGHLLVTDGVYHRVRHPMYAAHWLWAIAQMLLLHNWIAGPAFLVTFLPVYLRRVPHEERMLLDNFGQEYREYSSRTGRIIPRVGRS